MALPRRRPRDEHELPALPPLDGDDADERPLADIEFDADDSPVALDDSVADELPLDELELPEDGGSVLDDAEGPDDPGDLAEDIDDARERWSGDDEPMPDDPADLDEASDFAPDDQGLEGADDDLTEALDPLPPLDDDPEGDSTLDDERVEFATAPAFALDVRDGSALRVLYESELNGAIPDVTASVCVGRGRVLVACEAVMAFALSSLDDPEAQGVTLTAPPGGAVFSSVLEDGDGALWLATPAGELWRQTRARDAWRRVATLSEGRSTGAVELSSEGRRVWAVTGLGTLHVSDEVGRFATTLEREHVCALAVDPDGGVLAALSGRRRDPLRASRDGGATWTSVTLPEELTAGAIARAGDVCAVASGEGEASGYVSIDGGATWCAWPLLAGATALTVVQADDGDARVFFAVYDEAVDRAVLGTARVGSHGGALDGCRLAELSTTLPAGEGDDDVGGRRVERVVALDRAGRHLALVTARGAVVLASVEDVSAARQQ